MSVSISYISTNALYAGIRRHVEKSAPPFYPPTSTSASSKTYANPSNTASTSSSLPSAVNKKRLIQKAVFDELVALVNPHADPFEAQKGRVNVIMFVGLQSAGKDDDVYRISETLSDARITRTALVCAGYVPCGCF